MTESVLDNADAAHALFHHYSPQPLTTVAIIEQGRALVVANTELGLACRKTRSTTWSTTSADGPQPHRRGADDVRPGELQHCRHKIFNADWIIDGRPMENPCSA